MSELPTYLLERQFDAPPELVWRTWTEPELIARWYGPGVESIVHQLDVKPGGLWLHEMKWGENSSYQKAEYTQVSNNKLLVWRHSNTDANWNITPNPKMPDWPLTLLTTVTFEKENEKTKMRLTWVPHQASEAEIVCFTAALENMNKGWGAGMQLLEELLAELQA